MSDADKPAWKRIGDAVQAVRDAGIPDDLNRWLALTPDSLEAEMAKLGPREQQLRDLRSVRPPGKILPAPQSERKVMAVAVSPVPPASPGPTQEEPTMETQTTAAGAATGKKAAAKSKAKRASAPKKAAKKKAAAKRSVPSKAASKRGEKLAKTTKLALVSELLQRPDGCTTADVLKATGWPSVSMPAMAASAKLKLSKSKVDGVTRYTATPE